MFLIDKGTDIIIWGCGCRGRWFAEHYKQIYNICYYVDKKVAQNEEIWIENKYIVYNPAHLQKEDLNRCTVIIAVDKWEDVFLQLKYYSCIKIFENCFPWEYIEYQYLNPKILRFVHIESEKEKIIRKLAGNKKICVPFGFCHLQAYKRLLANSDKFSDKYILVDLPAINNRENELYDMLQEKAIYSTCDFFLLGVVPESLTFGLNKSLKDNLKEWIRSDCRVISITSAAFKGYFPQHTEQRNTSHDENGIPMNQYFVWGDKNINKLFKRGLSDDEISKKILDVDYYEPERFKRFFEHEFRLMEKAEEKCDVKIADYLRTIYDKKVCYYSWTHPIPVILTEISRRIALELGIDDDFTQYKDEDYLDMKINEEIIYPSVLKALGLYDEENLQRRVKPGCGNRLSTEEYISKYIKYVLKNKQEVQ